MLKKFTFFLISFFATFMYAENEAPLQKITCKGNICNLYALTDAGPKLVLSGSADLVNKYEGGWMYNSRIFAGFDIDCGTSCDYGYIVNYKTGQVSDQTFLVYAANMDKQVIVLPDPADNTLKTLLVRPFFCTKGIKIKRDFDPDNNEAIDDINFDKNGNLYLDYSVYPDYKEVKETIPIDYTKIAQMCSSS